MLKLLYVLLLYFHLAASSGSRCQSGPGYCTTTRPTTTTIPTTIPAPDRINEFHTRADARSAALLDARACSVVEQIQSSRPFQTPSYTNEIHQTYCSYSYPSQPSAAPENFNYIAIQDHHSGHNTPEYSEDRPHIHVRPAYHANGEFVVIDNKSKVPNTAKHYYYRRLE